MYVHSPEDLFCGTKKTQREDKIVTTKQNSQAVSVWMSCVRSSLLCVLVSVWTTGVSQSCSSLCPVWSHANAWDFLDNSLILLRRNLCKNRVFCAVRGCLLRVSNHTFLYSWSLRKQNLIHLFAIKSCTLVFINTFQIVVILWEQDIKRYWWNMKRIFRKSNCIRFNNSSHCENIVWVLFYPSLHLSQYEVP